MQRAPIPPKPPHRRSISESISKCFTEIDNMDKFWTRIFPAIFLSVMGVFLLIGQVRSREIVPYPPPTDMPAKVAYLEAKVANLEARYAEITGSVAANTRNSERIVAVEEQTKFATVANSQVREDIGVIRWQMYALLTGLLGGGYTLHRSVRKVDEKLQQQGFDGDDHA